MKFVLSPSATFAIALFAQGALGCSAQAQMSVVAKTTPGPSQTGSLEMAKANAWDAAVVTCEFAVKSSSCPGPGAGLTPAPAPAASATPQQTPAQHADLAAAAGEEETAVNAAVSALFKGQKITNEPVDKDDDDEDTEKSGSPVTQRLFQLSENVEWRVEPGELDGNNNVGVVASRTLSQSGDASLKFDAGVNLEAKNGSTAGKAGFTVAW